MLQLRSLSTYPQVHISQMHFSPFFLSPLVLMSSVAFDDVTSFDFIVPPFFLESWVTCSGSVCDTNDSGMTGGALSENEVFKTNIFVGHRTIKPWIHLLCDPFEAFLAKRDTNKYVLPQINFQPIIVYSTIVSYLLNQMRYAPHLLRLCLFYLILLMDVYGSCGSHCNKHRATRAIKLWVNLLSHTFTGTSSHSAVGAWKSPAATFSCPSTNS